MGIQIYNEAENVPAFVLQIHSRCTVVATHEVQVLVVAGNSRTAAVRFALGAERVTSPIDFSHSLKDRSCMKKVGRLRRTKRELLFSIFRRKFDLLEAVNVNVDFIKMQKLFSATSPGFRDRFELHRFVADTEVLKEPVDYVEFGVWKGDSIRFWTQLSKNPASRFFGFDTFTGLPEAWTPNSPAGTFSTDGMSPEIEDPRVKFIKGLFQETLTGFLQYNQLQNRLVVHVDCDLYSSTLFVLASMNTHLKPGAIIIFDDFYSLLHEFRAFIDYERSFSRSWKPLAHVYHCAQAAIRVE